ncbi:MAG: SGNH/GDSL hydrolase family protein, partial [Candidatus Firestonebacteria bacterium]
MKFQGTKLFPAFIFLLVFFIPLQAADTDLGFVDFVNPLKDKNMCAFPPYLTARAWRFSHFNDVSLISSRQSVGPDSSLLIFTEKGEKPGEILFYDTGCQKTDPEVYKGFSFWMRGDGGDGVLSLGTNWNQNTPAYAIIGTFPLSQKTWKKYFIPWSAFKGTNPPKTWWYWNAKVAPEKPRAAWALIARPSLYSEEITEPIKPVDIPDPAGVLSAEKFVYPEPSKALKLIPKTLAKLKAGKPVTIVVAGDSITAGAQMSYLRRNYLPEFSHDPDAFIYHAVLEKKLAAFYKYKKERSILVTWDVVNKSTGKNRANSATDSFFLATPDLAPLPDGSLPFDGLQVIGVGAGGKNTEFGALHLADITCYKPDLVIWMYGANDIPSKRTQSYITNSTAAIKELKQKGAEVILSGTTYFLGKGYFESSASFRDPGLQMAKELYIPFADQFGALTARGQRYAGDILSDNVHPNDTGHAFIASVLAAAFGVPDQVIWDQPYLRYIK